MILKVLRVWSSSPEISRHKAQGDTMFLCRGARSVFTSSLSNYNFAVSVHAATNIPQHAIWALHNPSIISCSQVRSADRVGVVPLPGAVLQGKCVNSCESGTGYRYCRSATGSGYIWPFSSKSKGRITKNVFWLGAETCIIRSSTHKLLSSALCTASPQKRPELTQSQAPGVHKGPDGGAEKPEPEQKLNKTQALKKVFKEYGAVGVSFHIGISLISLGIFYVVVSSGIDMTAVLCKLGFGESIVQSKMAAGTSTFVIAYAVHKLFAPFRISITLVSVPLIVRYLRKTGLFKPSPPRL